MRSVESMLERRADALLLTVDTTPPIDFVDLTAMIGAAVRESCLDDGLVGIHVRHTTAGLLINEHEPLLLEDLRRMFERLAPSTDYAHDDFTRRTVNLVPGERRNGHAHCRAALLRTSEAVPVASGELALGRWQRIFLVDFDAGQRREIALTVIGDRSRHRFRKSG